MPGNLVLVIGPSGPPELPVSLVHMALERREFSAALYLRDSEPPGALSTQALPPGALLWASRGHPPPCFLLRPQPRQRLSWSFQSLPTGVSVLPKCLDLGGWKGKCSQADLSFFPCHSFLEKKRTQRSGFA